MSRRRSLLYGGSSTSTPIHLLPTTLEQKVGQLFVVRPDITTSLTEFTQDFKNIIDQYHPGGILLAAQNISSKTQLTTLINQYKAYDSLRPLVISDEEGGKVARVAKSGILPSSQTSFGYADAHAVGDTGNVANAVHMGDVIGGYLASLGINGDYAPVADVNSNPNNPIIGTRAFGDTAARVSEMVGGFLDGMAPHNVMNCLKHFPGHGDTSTDTHVGLAIVYKTWEEMLQCEIIPYIDNLDKTDMVMVAHIIAETIDPGVPSSLSYQVVTGKLRNELGFEGVVTTDGMEMGAISQNYTPGQAALKAIQAGCDMICAPAELNGSLREGFIQAYNTILTAVQTGVITESRLDESIARIVKLKDKLYA